jgi:hypothetical protein
MTPDEVKILVDGMDRCLENDSGMDGSGFRLYVRDLLRYLVERVDGRPQRGQDPVAMVNQWNERARKAETENTQLRATIAAQGERNARLRAFVAFVASGQWGHVRGIAMQAQDLLRDLNHECTRQPDEEKPDA